MAETLTKDWVGTPGERLREKFCAVGSDINELANMDRHKWAAGVARFYHLWELKPASEAYREYADGLSEAWQEQPSHYYGEPSAS